MLHSTLYASHLALYTVHSTLYTLDSTPCTLHSTLYTPHCALKIAPTTQNRTPHTADLHQMLRIPQKKHFHGAARLPCDLHTDAALTLQFVKNPQHDTSKVRHLPRKMTMEVSKVLRLPRKMQVIFFSFPCRHGDATRKPKNRDGTR